MQVDDSSFLVSGCADALNRIAASDSNPTSLHLAYTRGATDSDAKKVPGMSLGGISFPAEYSPLLLGPAIPHGELWLIMPEG